MPLVKWRVEPERLANNVESKDTNLDSVVNSIFTNIILQLSSLSTHTAELFNELHAQAESLTHRASALDERVTRLKAITSQLNPTVEEVSLEDINARKPFRSCKTKDMSLMMRPEAITQIYIHTEPVPDLDKLNPYRDDNKDCIKLYTDPNYFFELWASQVQEEVERKMPARKRNRKQPKKDEPIRVHQAKVMTKEAGLGKEFMMDNKRKIESTVKIDSPANGPAQTSDSSSYRGSSQANGDVKSLSHLRRNQSTRDEDDDHLPAPPRLSASDSRRSRPSLPPPPPPPGGRVTLLPPPPSPMAGDYIPPPPPISSSRQADLDKVNNNIIDSFPPPPPLGPGIGPPPPPPPPPPSCFPPPPPIGMPPPPGPAMAVPREGDSGFGLRHHASVSKKRESRSDLLASIRSGLQLRKVEETEDKVNKKNAGGGLFDVQAILDMRRRALEEEDEEEEEDDTDWD